MRNFRRDGLGSRLKKANGCLLCKAAAASALLLSFLFNGGVDAFSLPVRMQAKQFTVPPPMRAPGAKELTHRTRFMSLDQLFPEVGASTSPSTVEHPPFDQDP